MDIWREIKNSWVKGVGQAIGKLNGSLCRRWARATANISAGVAPCLSQPSFLCTTKNQTMAW